MRQLYNASGASLAQLLQSGRPLSRYDFTPELLFPPNCTESLSLKATTQCRCRLLSLVALIVSIHLSVAWHNVGLQERARLDMRCLHHGGLYVIRRSDETTSNEQAVVSMALRLLTTLVRHRIVGYDDWFMVAAWLASIGYLTATSTSVGWGLGLDVNSVPPSWTINAGKSVYVVELFYWISNFLVKMSLLCLYLRLAADLRNFFYYSTLTLIAIVLTQFVATIIVSAVQCVPLAGYWDPAVPATCINVTAFFYSESSHRLQSAANECLATNAFTIVTDIIMLVLPVALIHRVNRPKSQKMGVYGAFLAGGLTTLMSCIRLYSVTLYTKSSDPLRDSAPIVWWSLIEIELGIVCASVPAIWPLFAHKQNSPRVPVRAHASFSNESKKHLRSSTVYPPRDLFPSPPDPFPMPADPFSTRRIPVFPRRQRSSARPVNSMGSLPEDLNFRRHDSDTSHTVQAQRGG